MSIGIDFDGTIADTRLAVHKCLRYTAFKTSFWSLLKYYINRKKITSGTLQEQLAIFVKTTEIESASEIYKFIYPIIGIPETKVLPGFEQFLDRCQNNDLDIYVISSKSDRNLHLSLEFLDLRYLVSFGGLDIQGKAKIIRNLSLDFYIGDQFSDMESADKGGAKGILLWERKKNIEKVGYLRANDYESVWEIIQNKI